MSSMEKTINFGNEIRLIFETSIFSIIFLFIKYQIPLQKKDLSSSINRLAMPAIFLFFPVFRNFESCLEYIILALHQNSYLFISYLGIIYAEIYKIVSYNWTL